MKSSSQQLAMPMNTSQQQLPMNSILEQLALPMNMNQQQLPPNLNPSRTTQLPAQPIPNPNNRSAQPIQNMELKTFPTYTITSVPTSEIQLRFGKLLNKT